MPAALLVVVLLTTTIDRRLTAPLRLLAEKVVELGYCKRISHTQVGNILKKTS